MNFRNGQERVCLDGASQFAFSENPEHCRMDSVASLRAAGLTIRPCTVPGNFELDLLANGLIEDPFFGMNIADMTRFEAAHVWYFREFEAQDEAGCDTQLVFEGLDCLADVYLNGRHIASCDNMLVEQPIDITGRLTARNELLVHFRPAVEEARRHAYPPRLRALGSNYESLYIRKAPHMYGWDIMPRAVSAGIWRPVRIYCLPRERIEQAYLETTLIAADKSIANLTFHYQARLDPRARYEMALEGRCGASHFEARGRVLFDAGKIGVHVDGPALWWPRGRGQANLYVVHARLLRDGHEVDSITFTHGIRTIRLLRTSVTSENGDGEFCFNVNGERIFVLGTNWVPADAYHSRDARRIPAILDLVEDIGCNMIRCWGGNVYENDLFFELCDRMGILIWQDFAMACAMYPQDEGFQRQLAAEARSVVRRLRQHPSLALWAGDNECDAGYASLGQDPNRNALTRRVLPEVLWDEDPGRPYLPSSPYIDDVAWRTGLRYLPEDHLWGPRDYFKGEYYPSALCHFASEIGYHGCPDRESLQRFLSIGKLWPYQNNEEWLLHCTSPVPGVDLYDYRVELMAKQVRVLFGVVPDNLDDFAFASQASQAEAMKFFIEMFRVAKWRRTGIIWWNIVDGWPQLSDAVVDYFFRRKLAYGHIKRSQAPVCLMLRELQEGYQELVACNDTREEARLHCRVRDIDSGAVLFEGEATAAPDAVTPLGKIEWPDATTRFLLLDWTGPGITGANHYLQGRPPYSLHQYRGWIDTMAACETA